MSRAAAAFGAVGGAVLGGYIAGPGLDPHGRSVDPAANVLIGSLIGAGLGAAILGGCSACPTKTGVAGVGGAGATNQIGTAGVGAYHLSSQPGFP